MTDPNAWMHQDAPPPWAAQPAPGAWVEPAPHQDPAAVGESPHPAAGQAVLPESQGGAEHDVGQQPLWEYKVISATFGGKLETELNASQHLSVAAEVGSLKIEVKRSLELDQAKICEILAEAPFLAGVLVKCEWRPVASRTIFGALAGQGEIAEKLKEAVSFKPQKPYFSPV